MARGIYRINRSAYPPLNADGDPTPFGDVVVVNPDGSAQLILYSGINPHPGLEALGARLVADNWAAAFGQLTASQRSESFDARWEETDEDGNVVTRRGRQKAAGAPVVRDPLIPVAFSARESKREQKALDES